MTLLTRSRGRNRSFGAFTPSSLFLGGIQGAWYDPSDNATMFQDAAGTTPVTAVEQPVGCILDKSGRGNHATQSTAASRPVLRARYNLLTYSEQFDNAAWIKQNGTISANTIVAPDAATTADSFIPNNGSNAASGVYVATPSSSALTTFSAYVRKGNKRWAMLLGFNGSSNCWFDLDNGIVGTRGGNYSSSSIVSVGNNWYRITATMSAAVGGTNIGVYCTDADNSLVCAGDGVTVGMYFWGAQLLTAADAAATGNAYQRIVDAATYATGGVFRPYLAFDGVDDRLQTASVNIASDAVSLFAGHSIQTAGGWGSIVTSGIAGGGGAFLMISDTTGAAAYQNFRSDGTLASLLTSPTIAYPYLDVWTMQAQISTDTLIARRNGAQTATSSSDQGTGTYASNVMYVGSYAGPNWLYPGRIYGLIVRGAASSTVEVAQTESWLNAKTGAY